MWASVVLLASIGVAAAIARTIFPNDVATRADPIRQHLLDALRRADPLILERPAELARFDGRFASHRILTLLHVVPGALFLVLAPLQFVPGIRNRHRDFHRWSGRVLMLAAFVGAFSALAFGVLMPYGGVGEAMTIALVATLFLVALGRAWVAIRKKQVAVHREWMIRAFATAVAVSTVRLVTAVLDIALAPAGVRPADLFVLGLWVGWSITLGAAELWIRRTRRVLCPAIAPSRIFRA